MREEHVQRAQKHETPQCVQRAIQCSKSIGVRGRGRDGVVRFTGGQDWVIKKLLENMKELDYHVRGLELLRTYNQGRALDIRKPLVAEWRMD